MSTLHHQMDDAKSDQDSNENLTYRQGFAKQLQKAHDYVRELVVPIAQEITSKLSPEHASIIQNIMTWNGLYKSCDFPLTHLNKTNQRQEVYTLRDELCEARRHLQHTQTVVKCVALHCRCDNDKCLVCERC